MNIFGDKLLIVIPYGNDRAQLHYAYGNEEGDVTLCRRDCYGWSIARDAEPETDDKSVYTCQRCVKVRSQ